MSNDDSGRNELHRYAFARGNDVIDQFPRMTTSSLDGPMEQRASVDYRDAKMSRDAAIVPSTKMTSSQFSGCHVFVK
jgi:hypothetical protein